jgi:formylmethanofuran dehydrogenase subunit E
METKIIRKLGGDGKISGFKLDEYMKLIKDFHGSTAPGLVIGGFMVDLALQNLPKGEFFDAIAETKTCLPDAIQLLTPCTIGNGWLRIMNFSRFAITLYEQQSGEGIRVYLDSSKIEAWPEVKSWFYKLKPKKEQNFQLLLDQIIDAGAGLCSMKRVRVKDGILEQKIHGSKIALCQSCGEAFKVKGSQLCPACSGDSPYVS